jgi:CheY-like chemotaxis protein
MMEPRLILVVDDETHILNVVAIKLQNAGYRVATAEDGLEAYEMARQLRPDLVITDYQMPALSGVELCARLREEPGLRDVPVIMLTARGFAISPRESTATNIRRVIEKPFSPREVLAEVNAQLQPVAPMAAM